MLLAVSLLGQTGIAVANEPAPVDKYQRAVQEYCFAATEQLRNIRQAVDKELKAASDDVVKRYADAYKGLNKCDELLAQLKIAPTGEFDRRKLEFEQAMAEMTRVLALARQV